MARRLSDIKETASDAVEIIRELRNPEVKNTLQQVKETATSVKEIVELLKEPEIVKNIENIRLATDSLSSMSANFQSAIGALNKSGVLSEVALAAKSAKVGISALTTSNEGLETIHAIKEMIISVRALVDELSILVASAQKPTSVVAIAKETITEATKAYKNIAK